jgi:hypothetical protein
MHNLGRRGRSTELGLLDDTLLAALPPAELGRDRPRAAAAAADGGAPGPELNGRCRSAELGRDRVRDPAPPADEGWGGRGLLERARCVFSFSFT